MGLVGADIAGAARAKTAASVAVSGAIRIIVTPPRRGVLGRPAPRSGKRLPETYAGSPTLTAAAARASQIEAQIGRHGSQAFGLGLQGTPAYLIGPYLVQGGLDDLPLAAAVRRARRSGRQSE